MPSETMSHVVSLLLAKGYMATHEYPGFIAIETPVGEWAIGNSNETWGGDFSRDCGATTIYGFNTQIPADSDDAEGIAVAIDLALKSIG